MLSELYGFEIFFHHSIEGRKILIEITLKATRDHPILLCSIEEIRKLVGYDRIVKGNISPILIVTVDGKDALEGDTLVKFVEHVMVKLTYTEMTLTMCRDPVKFKHFTLTMRYEFGKGRWDCGIYLPPESTATEGHFEEKGVVFERCKYGFLAKINGDIFSEQATLDILKKKVESLDVVQKLPEPTKRKNLNRRQRRKKAMLKWYSEMH